MPSAHAKPSARTTQPPTASRIQWLAVTTMQKKMLTGYNAHSTFAHVRRRSGHTASSDHVDQPTWRLGMAAKRLP